MKKLLNILLGVVLAVTVVLLLYAVFTGGSDAAISLNLIWGYILFVGALAVAVISAIVNMVKNPAGIKGSLISLALIVVVIGVAYFVAEGHTVAIENRETGGFFGRSETVLTEASILVTYVALLGAFLMAIGTEIYKAFK